MESHQDDQSAGVCELGLVSLEKRKLRRGEDLIAIFSCVMDMVCVEKMEPASSVRCLGRG